MAVPNVQAFFLIFAFVLSIVLIIFSSISSVMLSWLYFKKAKLLPFNPYRTFPNCLIAMLTGIGALFLTNFQIYFQSSNNIWTFGISWAAIVLSIWFAVESVVIFKVLTIPSLIIHANMLANAEYLLQRIILNPAPLNLMFTGLAIGLIATFSLQILQLKFKFVPPPFQIPGTLEIQTERFIDILKSNEEQKYLEDLTFSQDDYIKEHAQKTLDHVKTKKISRLNLKNNLFLLLLLTEGISIGRFRKLMYD